MSTLVQLFDKHVSNAKTGQKLVNQIMEAAKVKTTEDADKVYQDYKARVEAKIKDKAEATSIIGVFNSQRHRWMTAQGIKAKAHTGGKAGKTKAGKTTKVTKKAARAARAGTAKDQATPVPLHDMDISAILTTIRLIGEDKTNKKEALAKLNRIENQVKSAMFALNTIK